ncbi:tyrosine-protein phosphatase [Sphingomonas sp. TX0543]|uniref:tyrosine-protein phosphatase n=1 Tax=Sphingomonas sp. TX0543 TaxID=3399682 RepID=UPI003AFACD4E
MAKAFAAALGIILFGGIAGSAVAKVSDAAVLRGEDGQLTLRWSASGPVDVLQASTADARIAAATPVSMRDADGTATVRAGPSERRYFLLRDTKDGSVTRVAERLVPLQQGSNFRDIGGYQGAGGKHVRWGLIYRSGATPMLTAQDRETVSGLHLKQLIDLRSDEERVLAPTRIDGVTYTAYGYSMQRIFEGMRAPAGAPQNGSALYHGLPLLLAPQMKLLFAALLSKQGAIEYNCSAGQDRTGFATAMILSALGTPRDVIVRDYLLSPTYRRPQWEMPPIDPAMFPDNPVAKVFASNGAARQAQPLVDAGGHAFLLGAFEEIDSKWGSPEGYLRQVVGLSSADLATLRAAYLE